MLALRPWSAYELTKQMRRSLAYCWPKAESVLYDEPKRLVRLGLAELTDEPTGNTRTRAVYTITDAGRRELREWLASEPAPPRFEVEMLLRTLYADQGTKTDLTRALTAARGWVREEAERGLEQLEGFAADGGPFPERLHVNTLFADLVARLLEAVDAWTTDVLDEVDTWRGTRKVSSPAATQERLDAVMGRVRALLDRLDGTGVRA
jgi:DNA-binding PadR family transcriptional regulator